MGLVHIARIAEQGYDRGDKENRPHCHHTKIKKKMLTKVFKMIIMQLNSLNEPGFETVYLRKMIRKVHNTMMRQSSYDIIIGIIISFIIRKCDKVGL